MQFDKIAELAEAGGFTLPAELLKLEASRVRLQETYSALIRARNFADDGTQVGMVYADAVRAADNAYNHADDIVRGYVKVNSEQIVVETLRPAWEAVLADVRKNTNKGTPVTAEAAIDASDKVIAQYRKLKDLTKRFVAIKAAAQEIYGLGGRDNWNLFADTQAHPKGTSGQYAFLEPAGPSEPTARLLWLAHDQDAKPWLPTNAEREAASDKFQQHGTGVSTAHNVAVND